MQEVIQMDDARVLPQCTGRYGSDLLQVLEIPPVLLPVGAGALSSKKACLWTLQGISERRD